MVNLKGIEGSMPMSGYVAKVLSDTLTNLPFSDFFGKATVLIPVPRSAPIPPGGLWVPRRIADAMVARRIGYTVVPCLVRARSVNKSGQNNPGSRPLPAEHYDSFTVDKTITEFDDVVLVDDVVTRGSTLFAAASKLVDAYPGIRIRAFCAIRTISDSVSFHDWMDPVKSTITLRSQGDTIRRP